MIDNFYILRELSLYLNSVISEYVFTDSLSQEKDKLLIILTSKNRFNNKKYLEYSCDRKIPYLVLHSNFTKAKKNYAELFRECIGKEITDVDLLNNDRIIRILFSDNSFLLFDFIPYKYNVFYIKESAIISSFKSNDEFCGKNIDILLKKNIRPGKERKITCISYLKKIDNKLSELYVKEILSNSMLDESEEYNLKHEKVILKNHENIINRINNPKYILYYADEKFVISLLKLRVMGNNKYEEFSDVNSLIEKYLKETMKLNSAEESKRKLISEITKNIIHLEKKRINLRTQMKNSSNYQLMMDYGNIILSNMDKISRGNTSFEYNEENSDINYSIKLDIKLTPSQNAQKYFDLYKKQKDSINLIDNKISSVEKDLLNLREKLSKIQSMDSIEDLNTEKKKIISGKEDTESKHFRKFILDENFQVWVGKNAKSNDLLTFKYSNQYDLWFHIRGFSGSHTVLKKSSKNLEFPKEVIKTAASIAGYYSKARNSGTIPVAYTERKFVKKRKGFKEGSVVMEREKVVFVKPGLPFED